MLLIRRIEITNFVCFDHIEILPSTNREKPLTVIRAENGSGKTTLLRAIRWGMYGEKGLPGNPESTSRYIQPEWRPDANGIETRVTILFETDGSSRNHLERHVRQHRLRTSTIGDDGWAGNPAIEEEPDFRRVRAKRRSCCSKQLGRLMAPVHEHGRRRR